MTQNKLAPETHVISLKLTAHDDIFSDFDMRAYSVRALSVDFVEEIKRATRDKRPGGVELILYVPKHERNESRELIIKDRLGAHFKRHMQLTLKEKKRVLRLGIGMVILGIVAMIVASYIVFQDPTHNLLLSFLVVFLEPAAWYLLWEGMDQIVFSSKTVNPELNFYRRMSHSSEHIRFQSY